MDVDAAGVGVFVLGLEAIEPDDAGDDGIAAGGVDGDDLAGGGAMADDGAGGEIAADFIADAKIAERGLVAAPAVAGAVAGGGDGEAGNELAIADDGEALVRDAY